MIIILGKWVLIYPHLFHFSSVLGRIVRVTDEVVDYRKWIKENFPIRIQDNIMIENNNNRSYASVATSKSPLLDDNELNNNRYCRYIFI